MIHEIFGFPQINIVAKLGREVHLWDTHGGLFCNASEVLMIVCFAGHSKSVLGTRCPHRSLKYRKNPISYGEVSMVSKRRQNGPTSGRIYSSGPRACTRHAGPFICSLHSPTNQGCRVAIHSCKKVWLKDVLSFQGFEKVSTSCRWPKDKRNELVPSSRGDGRMIGTNDSGRGWLIYLDQKMYSEEGRSSKIYDASVEHCWSFCLYIHFCKGVYVVKKAPKGLLNVSWTCCTLKRLTSQW